MKIHDALVLAVRVFLLLLAILVAVAIYQNLSGIIVIPR